MAKFLLCFIALQCGVFCVRAQSSLPLGDNPPAIEFNYFPNRVYAMVWRNWDLVDPARLAKTVGCKQADILSLAESMGLPEARPIPSEYRKRMYITIIRRNWHLLSYEQLLSLLNMSSGELAVCLREDDFLFIKLGSLKPNCLALSYTRPSPDELRQAAQIKRLARSFFQRSGYQNAVPRFEFVQELMSASDSAGQLQGTRVNNGEPRILYSYFGVFGDPLMDTTLDPYPEGLLAKLAAKGINGVWLHVVLNQIAPGDMGFPEFGAGYQTRLSTLKKIVERAKKYGIGVYLYMNEPRSMPSAFFKNRVDIAGVTEGDFTTMCTSTKKVTDWITHSLTYVFKEVPGLGGVFTISASENLTNCASHGQQLRCPVCSKYSYATIIANVNHAIEEGVHAGNPEAKVIVWDWGWKEEEAAAIIAKLPTSVWFMSVSEWEKPVERGGVRTDVGEYAMSVVGPGPRAKRHWDWARKAGLKTIAKVQVNNTWELSAIPWIPVANLVAEHAANLAQERLDGYFMSWSLGGYPSVNLDIARAFAHRPAADYTVLLDSIAALRYGKEAAPFIRQAWATFSKAFQEFPFSVQALYTSPLQYGPANLLFASPSGYHATMVGFPYDDLDQWDGPYSGETFAGQFDKLALGWKMGLDIFKRALPMVPAAHKKAVLQDWQFAEAAYVHFASVANQCHFIIERNLLKTTMGNKEKQLVQSRINAVLDEEIKLSSELFDLTTLNPMIGFEASNQYYYVPQDLVEKIINCEFVRKQIHKIAIEK